MLIWIRHLDRILRGEATSVAALRAAEFNVPVWGLCVVIDVLGLVYGLCMGVFGLSGESGAWKQTVSCMFKVPALFLLTLLVTFPSLYVFNAMVGSRLTYRVMSRLLVASLAVMLAVLASIGPIVAFFAFTTTSYSFMVLLNVTVYAVAGALGMAFLLQSLHRLVIVQQMASLAGEMIAPVSVVPISDQTTGDISRHTGEISLRTGALDQSGDHMLRTNVRSVFRIWVLVFGVVGMQMAWVLSPFIAHPHQPFMLFRPVGSNFFQGVWQNIENLMR